MNYKARKMGSKTGLYDYKADFKNLPSVERREILEIARCLRKIQRKDLASIQEIAGFLNKQERKQGKMTNEEAAGVISLRVKEP